MMLWAVAGRAKQGQPVSGDVAVVLERPEHTLIAAIDGLGGGVEAEKAARLAEDVLRQQPDYSLREYMQTMHTTLHHSRGAVVGLLRLEPATQTALYTGVGNIGAHVYSRQPIKPISKNGIVGFRLPTLLELRYTYDPGDVFVLYSDGVSARFAQDLDVDFKLAPQLLADHILERYGKHSDDATVVVVKT